MTTGIRPTRRVFTAGLSALGLQAISSTRSLAQETWSPRGVVKFVVPFPAGGNADAIARLFADRMAEGLKQAIIIENRAGAAGAIGAQLVAQAPADGGTWLFTPSSVLVLGPHIRKTTYDPMADFEPVAIASRSYGIAAFRKDLPAATLKEFIALAKAQPDKLTFGSAGFASSTHIAGEIFHAAAGIKLTHVPYKGSADALVDLLAGRIDALYDPVALPKVQAGNLKALAIMGDMRHPLLPDVPTTKEQGYPELSNVWFGLVAPKGTPKAAVERMAAEAARVAALPETKDMAIRFSQYIDFAGPQATQAALKADSASYAAIVKKLDLAEKS